MVGHVFPRIFRYARRYPGYAIGTLLCAVVSTLTVIVFPAVTQRIVDDVIRQGHPEKLVPLLLTGLGAFLLQDILNSLRIILNNSFEQLVIRDLRSDLYAHVQTLPMRWFDGRSTGDIMTRLVEDVTSVERMLIDGIEQGVVAVLQIVIVGGLMVWYSPLLAATAAAPIPLLAAGALVYTLTARSRYRRQRAAASALNSLLHDNLAGVRQIRTYAAEDREHRRFNEVGERLRTETLNVMQAWAYYSPAMSFLASCGVLAIAAVGAWQVLDGAMDIGVLVAFLVLARFLYEPIGRLHQLNQLFQAGIAAGERVFDVMDAEPEPLATATPATGGVSVPVEQIRGDVEYRDVSFAYDMDRSVLEGVSLHAKPGEMVALVGATGAGKSTLVNLLVRFYEFTSGEILIDGRALRSFDRDSLRRAVAVVTQESFLFNGTPRDNLLLGKPDAGEEELWNVLAAANASDFVRRLPQGLDTPIGERGVKLSVGEKQRISIARALLKNPPILVLDEATASVDNATERLIQEALDRLMTDRTSFVIAHRLSTVQHANQILVMSRGRIVERGRHEELMELDGAYARLWKVVALGTEPGLPSPDR